VDEEAGERALSVREVAARLAVNPATVYRMLKSGELRGIWVGGVIRILPNDLATFIARATPADAPRPGWPSGKE
jgi:excisionase family DNA binding protein